MFELHQKPGSSSRDITIKLHPENHNRRAATTIVHYWNITKGYISPDGVHKKVYLINGQFPGPIVEARSGDKLIMVVSNQLEKEEGISIHWHGLHMKGANDMDGVVGVTQKAIPSGEDFTYEFDISGKQAGTFWYHSHSELQRSDGLYGGLVVHYPLIEGTREAEEYGYDEEQLLLVGDWYHYTAEEVQASYLTFRSSGHEPVPDSLLINGRGKFNCSMAIRSRPVDCHDVQQPSLRLEAGRTRLRVVNVGALAGFNISIPGGEMNLIQIDGGNRIDPVPSVNSIGVLYPGERMDIVLSSNSITNLTVSLDSENFVFQNQALTSVQTFPVTSSGTIVESPSKQGELTVITEFDLATARGQIFSPPMEEHANQTVLIYNHLEMLAHFDHIPMGFMNRTNWVPQEEPLIHLPRSEWDEHQFVPQIKGNSEWVDIVVNNRDDKGHPFHLHGYDFYVLTRHAFPRRAGYRTYNPFDPPAVWDEVLYPRPNVVNPPLKDTAQIPRRGYVILRIKTDNIGIWLFHCLVLWHQGTGMAMAFEVI
ncbi:multicopper oxidase [Hyaloscypha variabilis F]|uniref:Multicopper oxidase n=1 Tax=Hyaloscypha variabilis (strain UAMH 11265 / GT02V1 / F) TaxID=1149755 RepID=A0A2J6RRT8_HYAVF|nr:multicopper oxidase [Hyaloscypha variabilis F]